MSVAPLEVRQTSIVRPVRRFFRTPKGLLLIVLTGLAALAVPATGGAAIERVIAAATVAATVDVVIVWGLQDRWVFPSGGLLTGMIVGMVLSTHQELGVVLVVAVIAIAGKHLVRTRSANVFNPAALALVISSLLFGTAQSWWGALPDLGVAGALIVMGGGVFIADRVNKLPLVLAFLGSYFLLFTSASLTNPTAVAEVFRTPDVHAALFFALFMLDDPPTCPVKYRDQVPFGVIVAVGSYLCFIFMGAVYFLLAGLLVGNVLEAARRVATARPRTRRTTA